MAKSKKPSKKIIQKAKEQNPYVVDRIEDVADKFSVSTRTVGYWKRDGMPQTEDGKYDIRDIQEWRRNRKGRPGPDEEKQGELELWQTLERKQKALKAELEFKKLKGELIPREQVERGLIEASTVIKRSLINMPREIVPKLLGLNPKQIEMKLMERVKEIIQSFADETAFLVPKKDDNHKEKTEDLD